MPLDLSKIDEPKTRWISLTEPLDGVRLQIRHVGPREQEKFRQKMIRSGILKAGDSRVDINAGRETAFFEAYAAAFISDWDGDIRLTSDATDCPPYTPEAGGKVLGAYQTAFEQVMKAVGEEADFFSQNGAGSHG